MSKEELFRQADIVSIHLCSATAREDLWAGQIWRS